jgi:hypothetical protein
MITVALSERKWSSGMSEPLTVSINVKSGAFVPKGIMLEGVSAMMCYFLLPICA